MQLIKVLDRPICFQRSFVDLTHSITGALLLSQSVYWQLRCTSEDGWWWKTQEEWQEETGLTRKELETARKKCAPFLQMERRGVPAKCWYKVRVSLIERHVFGVQSTLPQTDKQNATNWANRGALNGQSIYKEITSDTTSENNPLPLKGVCDVKEVPSKSNSQSQNPPIANPPLFPANLQTPEFEAAWADWLRHLSEKRKKPTSLAKERQLKKLSAMGPQRAIAAIEYSIEKNWQGIFEDASAPVKEPLEETNDEPTPYKPLPARPPQMAPAFPDHDTDE